MAYTEHDPARPEQLRRAADEVGSSSQALHGSLTLSRTTSSALAARPFSGGTVDRFGAFLVSLDAALVNARASHEQLAGALQRVTGPIEDEQHAKRTRAQRRGALTDAEDALADAQRQHTAAQSNLSQAREVLGAKRQAIAYAQAANASRVAAGGNPAPIDYCGLGEAERQVERVEQEVRIQERLVGQASHRVDTARERLDRARRAHEEAEDARETAVRSFARLLLLAGVLPPLVLPPVTSTPADCPTGDEEASSVLNGIADGTSAANDLMLPPLEGLQRMLGGATGGILATELAKQLGVCPPAVIEPPTPPDPPDDDGGGGSPFDRVLDVVTDAPGFVKDAVTDAPGAVNDLLGAGNRQIDEWVEDLSEIPPPPGWGPSRYPKPGRLPALP